MNLGLDLSQSEAKIARARIHLESLKRELPIALNERRPYASRLTEIDEDGWCSFYYKVRNSPEHGLGVIVGDIIHNLRCALDYIVTALVEKSSAAHGNKHQFPIFTDQHLYCQIVGNQVSTVNNGCLAGIVHGLRIFWDVQPFQRKPEPEEDPLFHVHRFSNADKHRIVSLLMPLMQGGEVTLIHNGILVDTWQPTRLPDWKSDIEYELARFRFAKPYPTQAEAQSKYTVEIVFGTPAFGQYALGHAVDRATLEKTCDHVAMVTDLFKTL